MHTNDVTSSLLHVVFEVYCLRRKSTLKRRLSWYVHQALYEKIIKPIKNQDTWWTWLQMDQWPKHQHVKLQGLGGLPTRSTQLERYSRCPEQHDLSVQIQRLKRPLIANVWLPKLWASTIPSIWTCGRPNSGQGARRYGPRNASCVDKSEVRHIIFRDCFGDIVFVFKESNEYHSWR
jgi:hypothetical protein